MNMLRESKKKKEKDGMKELKKGSMNEKMDLTYDIVFDEYVIVPIIEKLVGSIHAIGSCEIDEDE